MKKNPFVKFLVFSLLYWLPSLAFAQLDQNQWAENQLSTMTLDEKVGQFFMIAAYSNKDEAHAQRIENLILNQKIGGVIFFQGSPFPQAVLTNRYQNLAKTPLLIGIDGETGLGMRLSEAIDMPKALTRSEERRVGKEC